MTREQALHRAQHTEERYIRPTRWAGTGLVIRRTAWEWRIESHRWRGRCYSYPLKVAPTLAGQWEAMTEREFHESLQRLAAEQEQDALLARRAG